MEALCADNVSRSRLPEYCISGIDHLLYIPQTTYETTPIKRITRTGVELKDGRRNELDVLILATGFDVSYHYPFDIVGRNGIKLNERWSPRAEAYMSVAVDGFPNLFLMYGPGSGLNTNSTISMLETQALYIVKCAAKLQRERLKWMTPKKEATDDWIQHMRVSYHRQDRDSPLNNPAYDG